MKQAQMDALIVEKEAYEMPYGGGEIEVKVEANVSFDVKPDVDWIHYVETKGLSSSTVRLTVDKNETSASRQGKIEIAQQNGDLKHTITVKQASGVAVTSITIDKTSLTLVPDETATLVATVKPDNATDKTVSWTSSDPAVASVDETGKVTAVKEGTATITASAGSKSVTCVVTVVKKPEGTVDLGIVMTREDGSSYRLFWAECNVGAAKPEDYGDYYAWGEIETKDDYTWKTYKWAKGAANKLTKYCLLDWSDSWGGWGDPDGKTVLDPEDDVAHVKLGGKWRMPTDAEIEALRVQCVWTRTTRNGVNGYEGKSRVNSNSIFLPAAGYRNGTQFQDKGLRGSYWSSSSIFGDMVGYAVNLYYYKAIQPSVAAHCRLNGSSIRPVTE